MKAIFFDIDGTLIDFDGTIPASALDALRKAQAKGHAIFLSSGRCKSMIDRRLLDFGFDGMIASSGAYVEYHDEVISAEFMKPEVLRGLIEYLEAHKTVYMFQCTDKIVASAEGNRAFAANLQDGDASEEAIEALLGKRVNDEDLLHHLDAYPNIEKACYQLADVGVDQVRQDLAPTFDITAMSFQDAPDTSGEITLSGINKAYGIQKVMDHLGITIDDVIAFGDGPNDYEMIEFAGTGVAMGNASEELKELADVITDTVSNDGVYKAMEQLQLI